MDSPQDRAEAGTPASPAPAPPTRQDTPQRPRLTPGTIFRCAVGGTLMGLANLVPGISGGTMLVVSGVYRTFIDAISDITRFRLSLASIQTLAIIVASALAAIVLLAGTIASLMLSARWAMYSIFIGLTWGSVPVLIALARPLDRRVWAAAAVGTIAMILLAIAQSAGTTGLGPSSSMGLLLLAGVAGASAMILPGVSGAYLLLLLGQYLPILESIDRTKAALRAVDIDSIVHEARVLVPVALGVVIGVAGVSNLLRWLLRRYEKWTLGVLLGLVIGAPAGLYPFKRGIEPAIDDEINHVLVTPENLDEFRAKPSKWREEPYSPGPPQIAGALALIALGAGATLAIARLGRERKSTPAP